MRMTTDQAFDAMKIFLEKYWESTGKSDELGLLLSRLDNSFTISGQPHDPALWDRWLEICQRVTSK